MRLSFPFWLADREKVVETEAMGFGPWFLVEPEDCPELDEETRAEVARRLARDPDLGLFRFGTRSSGATGCTERSGVVRTARATSCTRRRAPRQS